MNKTKQLILASFLAALAVVFLPASVNAETAPVTEPAPQTTKVYEYTATEGSSLSTLVRRSLQLCDQTNDSITLSEPGAMFAETNIVKKLGDRQLNEGEKVSIDAALVEEYAKKSAELSAAKLASWKVYSDGANFKLDDIKPLESTTAPTPQDPSGAQADAGDINGEGATTENESKKSGTNKSKTWQWIAVGVAGLGVIYYLSKNSSTKR